MAGRSRLVLSIWAHCICQAGAKRLTQQQAWPLSASEVLPMRTGPDFEHHFEGVGGGWPK